MRLGVVPIFMSLLCLIAGVSALVPGFFYVRHLGLLQETHRDALLEGYAEELDVLGGMRFEEAELLLRNSGAAALNDLFDGGGDATYSSLAWDESGRLLNEDAAPEWVGKLPENLFGDYLDQFVATGADKFRYDNFEAFRSGEAGQALCLRVRYFPVQQVFIGFGGPFSALSARLNAAKTVAYERMRTEALLFGGGLLLFLGVALFAGHRFFLRAVREPLRALAGGNGGKISGAGFVGELAQVGAGMGALKAKLEGLVEGEKNARAHLAQVREELDHLKSDFEYRMGVTERGLRDNYREALALEREALYRHAALALRSTAEGGALPERLGVILGDERSVEGEAEEFLLGDFLHGLAKEYAQESGQVEPKVNVQYETRVRLVKADFHGALLELLKNAYQHGGDIQGVHLNCARVEGRIEVSVSDSGVGIGESEKGLLFMPFYSTVAGRPGLGLAWARALCIRMGCELRVYSEEGKGFVAVVVLGEDAVARLAGTE